MPLAEAGTSSNSGDGAGTWERTGGTPAAADIPASPSRWEKLPARWHEHT